MSDVSCRITEGILRFMEQSGYPLAPLRAMLPLIEPDGRQVTEAMLRSSNERVSWNNYAKLMRAFPEFCDNDDVQQAFVNSSFSQVMTWIAYVSPIMRLLLSAERMLMYNQRAGAQLFANVQSRIGRLPDGRFHLTLEIGPQYDAIPAFFQITTKTMRLVPSIAGWPQAFVECRQAERQADYFITLPITVSWWQRLKIRFKVLLGTGASLREIGDSHDTMLRLYQETLKSEAELRQARNELEARVQMRTQELEQAVKRLEDEAAVRRAAEDRAALLGSLLDGSTQEIYILCAKSQRFLSANAGACRNLGYSREELLQMTPFDISARKTDDVRELTSKVASGEANHVRFVSIHRRKDGETYPIEAAIHKSSWGGKDVLISVAADISDRLRAEHERHQLMTELHAAQRRQSVGALAGGVAHEFNNILTPILAHVALIAPELSQGSRGSDSLERIERAVERGRNVVKQILALNHPTVGIATKVRLGDIVVEAVGLFRPTLPANIQLNVERDDDDLDCVLAVAAEIHQIVLNLLTNAEHALHESGGDIRISVTREGGTVVLTASDNGCGMDEGTRSKIFDPFFTTKEPGKGSGIGLSVVRDITARYGATVNVDSAPGRGTTFVIAFPAVADGTALNNARANYDKGTGLIAPGPEVHGRVLLVDDEEEIAFVMGEALRYLGFDITTAVTPEEALQKVAATKRPFDLVVTDMSMPNMNGLELAKAIRSVSPSMRVCLLSGYTLGLNEAVARTKDIHAVFDKPIEPSALAAAMRAAISG